MDKMKTMIAVVLLLAVSLAGCGSEDAPSVHDGQAVTIDAEGTVLCELVESFDKDYYDADELKSIVSEEISEFNGERLRSDAAQLVDVKKTGDKVRMSIRFATTSDFMEFNDCLLLYDSVAAARDSGYTFSGDLTDKNGTKITSDALSRLQNAHVVICDDPYTIETPYDIKYCSGGIDLTGKHTAVPGAGVKLPMVLILNK